MKRIEKTISTEKIFEGKMISLYRDIIELPNGKHASREIVRHPGAVTILVINNGKILMVEQYRKAIEAFSLEIPAGKLEIGEEPLEAAKRELEEETGYQALDISLLHTLTMSPGFCDEKMYLYTVNQIQEGTVSPDEDEFLSIHWASMNEMEEYISSGKIQDVKTILAYYIWKNKQ